jgi:hypothetical protein
LAVFQGEVEADLGGGKAEERAERLETGLCAVGVDEGGSQVSDCICSKLID